MLQRIQSLGQGQRILLFVLFFVGGLLLIVGITVFLILLSANTGERTRATALSESVTVSEFAYLPDEDAYPTAVTVGADGTVYTASYMSGTVWAIDADKPLNPESIEADAPFVRELPDTRDQFASVRGLAAGDNGLLYVLDGGTSDPRQRGGVVWVITPEGTISPFGQIQRTADPDAEPDTVEAATGFLSPFGITLDGEGNVYVTDRGLREVWRFSPDGSENALFWAPPADDPLTIPTGITYDPTTNSLLLTDSELSTVYRIAVDNPENTEVLYRYTGATPPGLTGITVDESGKIYAAALDQNGVVTWENGEMTYIVGTLRGVNDVEAANGLLYLTNFDSASLVLPGFSPQLPFALDVVDLQSQSAP